MLKAYSNVFIDFRFKTLEPNGLLFYNGGKRNDFIAVELVNGHIHYVFDMGDGPITIRDKARVHMNDNRWHSVSIRRPGPRTHTLIVEDSIEVYTTTGNNVHLDLEGILYVGGVFKDMYSRLPVSIASRAGFEGCLASVDLTDLSASLTEDAIVPSSLVVAGCEGPTKCSQNACANRGLCVQQWNAYACECDMTSFTGPTCYDGKTFPFLFHRVEKFPSVSQSQLHTNLVPTEDCCSIHSRRVVNPIPKMIQLLWALLP